MDYPYIVLIHVIAAILFLGAIATEVLALGPLRRHLSDAEFQKIEFLLFRQIRRTYPPAVIALFATGFWMYFIHMSGFETWGEFVATSFGFWLTVKMVLALGMAGVFTFSPFVFMPSTGPTRDGLRHFLIVSRPMASFRTDRFDLIHLLVFALGMAIVVIAKLMFVL